MGKLPVTGGEQALDDRLVAVDIEETANDLRSADRVDRLDVDLNELGEAILVKVKDKVEPVADNDERELVLELGLLEGGS